MSIIALSREFSLLFFFITFFWALKTFAKEEENNINTPVLFHPPGEEQPEDTKGGGSRDEGSSCDRDIMTQRENRSDGDKLTAIAPNSYYGLTTAERPTFCVNVLKT